MEKESFEDEEVAKILNDNFISIKVDREERPDIDNIYMSLCQVMTGSGGWPLTIIMTSEKLPFFTGTYFLKTTKYGNLGLIELLNRVSEVWKENKSELIKSSNEIVEKIKTTTNKEAGELSFKLINKTFKHFKEYFDPVFGGFGDSPKFPSPHNLTFLLRHWRATGEEKSLEIVKATLDNMYKGGIFDHIGGGFSRYSVDKKWLVPHFEKMLYDNALLAITYLETYQATKENRYKEVAEKIFAYVLRDMTDPNGGFYCAEDADSEGVEGKFYLWDKVEIENILSVKDAKIFCTHYGITSKGNYEEKNIPNLIGEDLAMLEQQELRNKLEDIRKKLFQYREKRVHPYKDDKILTSWNGLMIVAMAYGARVLGEEKYLKAATNALNFIFDKLQNKDGRLLARYRNGDSAYLGYLDDYAFLVWALIEMYETTFNYSYIEKALRLNKDMLSYFWDEKDKGLFLNGKDSEQLILRSKEAYDGAIPSGNSVAALNMLKLSRITEDKDLETRANEIFKTFGGSITSAPYGHSQMMSAFLFSRVPEKKIVIAGNKNSEDTQLMFKNLNERFLPFSTVIFNDGSQELSKTIPSVASNIKLENKATAYICQNYTCSEPTIDIKDFNALLDESKLIST